MSKPEEKQNARETAERSEVEQKKQTLLYHLNALRKVLVVSAGAVLIAFAAIFYGCIDWMMGLITGPISARGIELIYTAMSEALMTKFKVALIAGVVVASPVIIWQLWRFIKPALYPHERKLFRLLFFVALILFLIGVVFCYFAVYFLAVDFFLISGENLATPMLSIDKYVSFLFGFLLPFGVAFQLPVFMFITTRMGWTNANSLASKRKYVILALAIVAAILTPPDVVSQLMLLVPMCVLFELGVLVSKTVKPRVREENADEAA